MGIIAVDNAMDYCVQVPRTPVFMPLNLKTTMRAAAMFSNSQFLTAPCVSRKVRSCTPAYTSPSNKISVTHYMDWKIMCCGCGLPYNNDCGRLRRPLMFSMPKVYDIYMSLISNKKAHFNYEILEKFEAGLVLAGYEVKSLRKSQGSLEGSRVLVRGNEAFLVGASVPAFQPANAPKNYDPLRPRKLLLNTKEIGKIMAAEGEKGLTVVPISVYNKGRNLKIEIAIGRGKKLHDKRETIKKRDTERDMRRSLKNN